MSIQWWNETREDYVATAQRNYGACDGQSAIYGPDAIEASAAMSMLSDAQEALARGFEADANRLINAAKLSLSNIMMRGNLRK